MTISEETRHKIHEAFRAMHGDEVANGLMELLPPVGWADVATKHDLAQLEERMDLRFEAVNQRLATFVTREDLQRELRLQGNRFIAWVLASVGLLVALLEAAERIA